MAETLGTEWFNAGGSYGYSAVMVRYDADERNGAIREFFEGLANYPLASDDDESALEMEMFDAAWEDYGRRDFAHDLDERQLGEQVPAIEPFIGALQESAARGADDNSDRAVDHLFHLLGEEIGEPFRIEEGGSVYFNSNERIELLQRLVAVPGLLIYLFEILLSPDLSYEQKDKTARTILRATRMKPKELAVLNDLALEQGLDAVLAHLQKNR